MPEAIENSYFIPPVKRVEDQYSCATTPRRNGVVQTSTITSAPLVSYICQGWLQAYGELQHHPQTQQTSYSEHLLCAETQRKKLFGYLKPKTNQVVVLLKEQRKEPHKIVKKTTVGNLKRNQQQFATIDRSINVKPKNSTQLRNFTTHSTTVFNRHLHNRQIMAGLSDEELQHRHRTTSRLYYSTLKNIKGGIFGQSKTVTAFHLRHINMLQQGFYYYHFKNPSLDSPLDFCSSLVDLTRPINSQQAHQKKRVKNRQVVYGSAISLIHPQTDPYCIQPVSPPARTKKVSRIGKPISLRRDQHMPKYLRQATQHNSLSCDYLMDVGMDRRVQLYPTAILHSIVEYTAHGVKVLGRRHSSSSSGDSGFPEQDRLFSRGMEMRMQINCSPHNVEIIFSQLNRKYQLLHYQTDKKSTTTRRAISGKQVMLLKFFGATGIYPT
uniref:Uncharacterized protein n=1 Tax=Ditylenchus dipsaci TaxID=166011 RepID=A0A915ECX1_9BILA